MEYLGRTFTFGDWTLEMHLNVIEMYDFGTFRKILQNSGPKFSVLKSSLQILHSDMSVCLQVTHPDLVKLITGQKLNWEKGEVKHADIDTAENIKTPGRSILLNREELNPTKPEPSAGGSVQVRKITVK
jgi:hypothetical protein